MLNRAYPTYGKLLKAAGYQTPYVGKWHVSIPPQNPQLYLKAYGFDGMTLPDPTGSNLQGTVGNEQEGYHNDQFIADQAVRWLRKRSAGDQPWCLTVGFVNPHDKEFFWAGTEFKTFNDLYDQSGHGLEPFTFYSYNDGTEISPLRPLGQEPAQESALLRLPRPAAELGVAGQAQAHQALDAGQRVPVQRARLGRGQRRP